MLEDCADVAQDGFQVLRKGGVAVGEGVLRFEMGDVVEDFGVCEGGEAGVEDLGGSVCGRDIVKGWSCTFIVHS